MVVLIWLGLFPMIAASIRDQMLFEAYRRFEKVMLVVSGAVVELADSVVAQRMLLSNTQPR